MIEGIIIQALKIISHEKGDIMHMIRQDAPFFKGFGEVYFSNIKPGHIKAWKKHLRQTQRFAVPIGDIKLVVYDEREGSKTKGEVQEIIFGVHEYQLVVLPPGLWYGFKTVDDSPAMIVNCTDIPHEPDESVQMDPATGNIPYSWDT